MWLLLYTDDTGNDDAESVFAVVDICSYRKAVLSMWASGCIYRYTESVLTILYSAAMALSIKPLPW